MTTESSPLPTSDPPSEAFRQLLEAAAQCFDERGYDATSVQDIAKRLGKSKSSIYSHIGSKSDLLFEISRWEHERFGVISVERDDPSADGATRVRLFCEAHLSAYLISPTNAKVARRLTEVRDLDRHLTPEQGQWIRSHMREYQSRLRDLIVIGQMDGTVSTIYEPNMTALLLLGMLNSVNLWYRPGRFDPAELMEAVCNLLLSGLLTPLPSKGGA